MEKTKKKSKSKEELKPCEKCYGFGWWPIGGLCPIGRMDGGEWGNKVIQCPWCKNGFVDKGERYETLKKVKEKEAKEKKHE
jgi:hypothetical protein